MNYIEVYLFSVRLATCCLLCNEDLRKDSGSVSSGVESTRKIVRETFIQSLVFCPKRRKKRSPSYTHPFQVDRQENLRKKILNEKKI